MSANRIVGYTLGAVYLLVGIAGFAVTNNLDFFAREGNSLLGFEVNPFHNVVHILIGLALLGAAAASTMAARGMNMTIGIAYALVGLYGLFVVGGDSTYNILALNAADNVLHFATAAITIAVAALADKEARHERTGIRRAA